MQTKVAENTPTLSDTLYNARAAGISLALTDRKDGILAGPREALTQEFRDSIAANRDEVLRHLLFREAAHFFHEHLRRHVPGPDAAAARAGYEALSDAGGELEDAWSDADLEGFKDALRSWLRTGLRAHEQAARSEAARKVSPTDTGDGKDQPDKYFGEVQPELAVSTEKG